MRKCANISPYMRRPLVIYDFATAPFWISLYSLWGKFDFLFYQCRWSIHYNFDGEGYRGYITFVSKHDFYARKLKYVLFSCYVIFSTIWWCIGSFELIKNYVTEIQLWQRLLSITHIGFGRACHWGFSNKACKVQKCKMLFTGSHSWQ
jgi:hypothetical protein